MSELRAMLSRLSAAQRAAYLASLSPEAFALFRADNLDLFLIDHDFAEQAAFIRDPAPFKAAFCTRRAAKSYSVGLEYVLDAQSYPGAHYLFLMTVREQAKRDFWEDVLKPINAKHELGITFNETELVATLPNKAKIYVGGADSSSTEWRKKIAGKYRKVHIDEAQAFIHTNLRTLVYEAFKPAVADHRGSIGLSGTPGDVAKGFFYDVTTKAERGWSVHSWTTEQNPHMREKWALEIAELKALKPGVEETPWFRRGYLREWVTDETLHVYRYLAGRNDFDGKLPTTFAHDRGGWHHVLGMDLGWKDPSAIVIWAYHDHDSTLYCRYAEKRGEKTLTEIAEWAREIEAWLRSEGHSIESWIVDGANKQAVEEMRTARLALPLQAADKAGKADFIELMNADYILGKLKLAPGAAPLATEYAGLVWDKRALEKGKREENPACDNHACDAALYGWRHCYNYLATIVAPTPPRGTPEWNKAEEARMLAIMLGKRNGERQGDEQPFASDTTFGGNTWDPYS